MPRSMIAVALLVLLWGTSGAGWAQDGGWFGARLSSTNSTSFDFATQQGSSYAGSKVEEVLPNSPAAAGGLKVGDVILSVDGRQAEDVKQLIGILRQTPSGSVVRVRVKRDRDNLDLSVVLGQRPQGN
jgi:S1-C subfamily serine protease